MTRPLLLLLAAAAAGILALAATRAPPSAPLQSKLAAAKSMCAPRFRAALPGAATRGRRLAPVRSSETGGVGGGADPILLGLRAASPVMSLLKPVFKPLSKVQAGSYDAAATQKLIDADVKSSPVVVYGYALSPFCTKAVDVLKSAGVEPKVVDLGLEWIPGLISSQGAAIRAHLGETTGRTSMPHIFIGGQSIGGLVDGTPGLLPLRDSGELVSELKKARAL
uniref:Glutaredoxin domain-containing protein n=1 Tax=Lotharella oceanica TaxID=641309 RepID=A0A7S2TRR9_9EUKA